MLRMLRGMSSASRCDCSPQRGMAGSDGSGLRPEVARAFGTRISVLFHDFGALFGVGRGFWRFSRFLASFTRQFLFFTILQILLSKCRQNGENSKEFSKIQTRTEQHDFKFFSRFLA